MADVLDTGVLYRDDNLSVLQTLPDESVDLVYLDPPFFSNRVYEVIWGDEAEVRSFEDRWAGGIQNYIDWMKGRLVELHRLLKPNGSLYLHCDPHASHYLKVMLDGIFGMQNFRTEIVWKRSSAHSDTKQGRRQHGRIHDIVLFYTKSNRWTWNPVYTEYDESYIQSHYRFIEAETGRRFRKGDLTAAKPGGDTLYEWRGVRPYKGRYWAYSQDKMEEFERQGRLIYTRTGMPELKRYLDEMPGVSLQDVWTDIDAINARAAERLGYPTQKPEALLTRIIRSSSDPEHVVLDPFCGCGTTVAVAEALKRRWIGIDISATAVEIMRRRLLKRGCSPRIENAVDSLVDLKALKPFEFQNWVINAVYGTHSPKKVGDMGIDGYWFFTRDPIQVKQSEHVGRNVVDNFQTAVRRAGHTSGYIIGFSFTRGAVEEAARARKDEGLDIKLVKVAEVLLMVKRPHGKLGPQPGSVEELPLPAMRKPQDLPSADELVESDRSAVV
jgi:DNA modification methylase